MNIVFFGTPSFAADILSALLRSPQMVTACVSPPDRPRDRGKKVIPTPVRALAESNNIPVLSPERANDKEFIEELKAIAADIFVVAAYRMFLPKTILNMPKYGCVNVHASVLPKYRGASPVTQAILNGDKRTGVTIMQMAKGMDTGDILHVRTLEIESEDTTGTLTDRLATLGGEALLEALELIEAGKAVPVPQDNESATYAPLITKEMGILDFSKPAIDIVNRVRAMNPWPGASAEISGHTLKVWKAEIVRDDTQDKNRIIVKCGDGSVSLTEVQAPGGKRLPASEYLRGHKIFGTCCH